ncbi:MAG: mandelate racemase, partial [Actinobacteria bacterium]|nr:mandelate racemase [Actinomycetota bacterium]
PEADGTLQWGATIAVTVKLGCGEVTGLGWTYSSPAAAAVITHHLSDVVSGRPVADVSAGHEAMRRACRNFGTKGLVAQAISAVDVAWWDLRARMNDQSVTAALGRCRDAVPVYGSGGFTTMTDDQLAEQVAGWTAAGCRAMKIKIGESWGSAIDRDRSRVEMLARLAPGAELMVDANGGYDVGVAARVGAFLDELGVTWFEEPVSSDDIGGLAQLRPQLRCDVAAGEYASDLSEVRTLVDVVDCLQLDVTRCGGFTGWLAAAAVARAKNLAVSGHCAPALHAYVGGAVPHLRHVEWFADHARLEPLLFDGIPPVRDGALQVRSDVLGHGMTIAARAEAYQVG